MTTVTGQETTGAGIPVVTSKALSVAGWQKEEKKIIAFGASHLVLIVSLCLAVILSVYLWDSKRADQADARAVLAMAHAQASDQQNKMFQVQVTQQIAALAEQNKALQSQVFMLVSAIAQRDAALSVKTQEIKTLPPTTLATQWGAAAQEPAPTIDDKGNFLATLPLAQKSLVALATVPVLQSDKQDLQTALDKERQVVVNDASVLSKEQSAHLADVNACKADLQASKAETAKAKADGRKGKIKSFLYGLVTGAVVVASHFI